MPTRRKPTAARSSGGFSTAPVENEETVTIVEEVVETPVAAETSEEIVAEPEIVTIPTPTPAPTPVAAPVFVDFAPKKIVKEPAKSPKVIKHPRNKPRFSAHN